MTFKPVPREDAELQRLRGAADHLRVKLSLAADRAQVDDQDLSKLREQIATLERAIVSRMRDLSYRPDS